MWRKGMFDVCPDGAAVGGFRSFVLAFIVAAQAGCAQLPPQGKIKAFSSAMTAVSTSYNTNVDVDQDLAQRAGTEKALYNFLAAAQSLKPSNKQSGPRTSMRIAELGGEATSKPTALKLPPRRPLQESRRGNIVLASCPRIFQPSRPKRSRRERS